MSIELLRQLCDNCNRIVDGGFDNNSSIKWRRERQSFFFFFTILQFKSSPRLMTHIFKLNCLLRSITFLHNFFFLLLKEISNWCLLSIKIKSSNGENISIWIIISVLGGFAAEKGIKLPFTYQSSIMIGIFFSITSLYIAFQSFLFHWQNFDSKEARWDSDLYSM